MRRLLKKTAKHPRQPRKTKTPPIQRRSIYKEPVDKDSSDPFKGASVDDGGTLE
jgi:hypothetical protein